MHGALEGGPTAKIHALVDANGLPVALKLTPGQAHDGRSAADMFDGIGEGQSLADRGAWGCTKPMPNRKAPSFSPFLYRYRNLVKRFLSKIMHFRAVTTRFEKHAENYLALVKLAAIQIWLRFYESVS